MAKEKTIKKNKKPSNRIKREAVNKKGVFEFIGNDNKKYRLTLKEKLFCERYLDYTGNGAEAAWSVYKCKTIRIAASLAYENLIKPHIMAYVDKRIEDIGFNDDNVKKQHLFTLNQFSDLSAKNKAIDMFYRVKGQYAPENINLKIDPLDELTNAELVEVERKLIEGLTNKKKK
jgi:hypothetical protein